MSIAGSKAPVPKWDHNGSTSISRRTAGKPKPPSKRWNSESISLRNEFHRLGKPGAGAGGLRFSREGVVICGLLGGEDFQDDRPFGQCSILERRGCEWFDLGQASRLLLDPASFPRGG